MEISSQSERLKTPLAPWRVVTDEGALYIVEMPVADWIGICGHPRRRDTDRQARKGHWKLARRARGALREVQRAVIGAEYDGNVYKVDGHARAWLWASNELPIPDTVLVTIYRCQSDAELNAIYDAYDTQEAAETLSDRVTGAYRACGLTLNSSKLRHGMIGDALSIALRGMARSSDKSVDAQLDLNIYEAVRMYAAELQQLDALDPPKAIFHTGITAAALIALALEPKALGFFECLAGGQGSVRGELRDPVQAVLEIVGRIKQGRSGWEKAEQEELCAITLRAAFAWCEGERSLDYWTSGNLAGADVKVAVARVCESRQARAPASTSR